jgi:hypothetical protein
LLKAAEEEEQYEEWQRSQWANAAPVMVGDENAPF